MLPSPGVPTRGTVGAFAAQPAVEVKKRSRKRSEAPLLVTLDASSLPGLLVVDILGSVAPIRDAFNYDGTLPGHAGRVMTVTTRGNVSRAPRTE